MKNPWLAVSPAMWAAMNASASHNTHRTNIGILQLTWELIVVGVFKTFTVETLIKKNPLTWLPYILTCHYT